MSARRSMRVMICLGATVAAAAACSMERPGSYVAPAPGTVYRYSGAVTNTITGVDGWRTTYIDQAGRSGSRLALFITEAPGQPAVVDSGALDRLWPLEGGKETAFGMRLGPERYRWEFRVRPRELVTTPAGTYDAYVVQGVVAPELVRDPSVAATVMHTWWYDPDSAVVVRFRSQYLSGPAVGRMVEAELESVQRPPPPSA